MLHSKHITLSAGATEDSLTKTQFDVNKGVISMIWLTFPAGCVGLVKVRLKHQGYPFLPVDIKDNISGDNYVFVYPVMFEIKTQPEDITIEAWNEDALYNHTIDIQVLIIDKEWVQPVGAYEGIIAALKSIFERRI